MAIMKKCIECGRTYELRGGTVAAGHTRTDLLLKKLFLKYQ
jgi:hypothetical protein